MKFSSQEEYGLRCLLRIARNNHGRGLTIPEISRAEGISEAHVAKLLRILRLGGYLESSRGQKGGYSLRKPPEEIMIKEVLNFLGGRLYDDDFCLNHTGELKICTNSVDCSIRSLWQMIQTSVDETLKDLTLKHLITDNLSYFQIAENKGKLNF